MNRGAVVAILFCAYSVSAFADSISRSEVTFLSQMAELDYSAMRKTLSEDKEAFFQSKYEIDQSPLFIAAASRNLTLVDFLLNQKRFSGISQPYSDDPPTPVLPYAIEKSSSEIVELILKQFPEQLNNVDVYSFLHRGDDGEVAEILQILVKYGFDAGKVYRERGHPHGAWIPQQNFTLLTKCLDSNNHFEIMPNLAKYLISHNITINVPALTYYPDRVLGPWVESKTPMDFAVEANLEDLGKLIAEHDGAKYLDLVDTGRISEGIGALINDDHVRLRASDSSGSKILAVLDKNTTVVVIRQGATETIGNEDFPWLEVKMDSKRGWVFGKYLLNTLYLN